MSFDMSGLRWQGHGGVAEKREYKDSKGNTKHGITVMTMGDSVQAFGDQAEALLEKCPEVGEECIFGGKLKKDGVNKFGKTLYMLEMDLIQSPNSSGRRSAA